MCSVCSPAKEVCSPGAGDNGSHRAHTPQVAVSLTGPRAHTAATEDKSNLLSSLLSPACHCVHQTARSPPLQISVGNLFLCFQVPEPVLDRPVSQHLSQRHDSASPPLDGVPPLSLSISVFESLSLPSLSILLVLFFKKTLTNTDTNNVMPNGEKLHETT